VRAAVDLSPTGTGRSLAGRVLGWPEFLDVLTIEAQCSGVERLIKVKGRGPFRIDDVGSPPCTVHGSALVPKLCGECDPRDMNLVDVHAEVQSLPGNVVLDLEEKSK